MSIKVSYKVTLSLMMGMMNHSQSTQSNKIAIPLQYLKKEVRDGVIFCTLHDRSGQACSTCSKFLYCDTKHSDIFRGSSHVCCYLITINLTFFWTLIEYAIISLVFWKSFSLQIMEMIYWFLLDILVVK